MALHQFANDFFTLLSSTKTDSELEALLHDEFKARWEKSVDEVSPCSCG